MCRTIHALLSTLICGIQMIVRVFMTITLMAENVIRMILQTLYNFISFMLQLLSLIPILLVFVFTTKLKCFMCGGGGPCPVNRGGACDCIMFAVAIAILFFIFKSTGVLEKIIYNIGYIKIQSTEFVKFVPTPGEITNCSRNDTDYLDPTPTKLEKMFEEIEPDVTFSSESAPFSFDKEGKLPLSSSDVDDKGGFYDNDTEKTIDINLNKIHTLNENDKGIKSGKYLTTSTHFSKKLKPSNVGSDGSRTTGDLNYGDRLTVIKTDTETGNYGKEISSDFDFGNSGELTTSDRGFDAYRTQTPVDSDLKLSGNLISSRASDDKLTTSDRGSNAYGAPTPVDSDLKNSGIPIGYGVNDDKLTASGRGFDAYGSSTPVNSDLKNSRKQTSYGATDDKLTTSGSGSGGYDTTTDGFNYDNGVKFTSTKLGGFGTLTRGITDFGHSGEFITANTASVLKTPFNIINEPMTLSYSTMTYTVLFTKWIPTNYKFRLDEPVSFFGIYRDILYTILYIDSRGGNMLYGAMYFPDNRTKILRTSTLYPYHIDPKYQPTRSKKPKTTTPTPSTTETQNYWHTLKVYTAYWTYKTVPIIDVNNPNKTLITMHKMWASARIIIKKDMRLKSSTWIVDTRPKNLKYTYYDNRDLKPPSITYDYSPGFTPAYHRFYHIRPENSKFYLRRNNTLK